MKKNVATLVLIVIFMYQINGQTHQGKKDNESSFRVVGIISHTMINTKELDNVWIPSWGLDIEYWFNNKWGIGLHNDIEIENFVIKNSGNNTVERINPLVITIDALYHFSKGLVFTFGPGIEIEKNESFILFRLGIEYEKDISETFYILPNLFLDQRLDGYKTFSIGLGVGMRL